ncbi:hypothetical protein J4229_03030 [Candidatus Pacearchaeota archaeon]|nr:hypothetical protein [Candidatus Pacearchaeota archaeon]
MNEKDEKEMVKFKRTEIGKWVEEGEMRGIVLNELIGDKLKCGRGR